MLRPYRYALERQRGVTTAADQAPGRLLSVLPVHLLLSRLELEGRVEVKSFGGIEKIKILFKILHQIYW